MIETTAASTKFFSVLLKTCPACGGRAQAEAGLPISAGVRPAEIDLERLGALAEQLSLGQLLALVEVIPYKQFHCASCGHEFKLASQTAKGLLLEMVNSMQPVAPAPKKNAARDRPKAAAKAPPAVVRPRADDDGWEPQAIDPGL